MLTHTSAFSKRILVWWDKQDIYFPWRESKDAYSVLIAEILLRKTTAVQVKRVYGQLITAYPTPLRLAKAKSTKLEEMLRPLGMEMIKAGLLINIGKRLTRDFDGFVPTGRAELLSLPGVGRYTTNAVLSLSFNQPVPMVDTNVIRLLDRAVGFKSAKQRAREDPEAWNLAARLLLKTRPGESNLAMIDLARLICVSRNPRCQECPLQKTCLERNKNVVKTNGWVS